MSNPVLTRTGDKLRNSGIDGYNTNRMTLNDVGMTTLILFTVLLVFAGVGWFFGNFAIFLIALAAALVLGLVAVFKATPNPALMLGYAVAEGYVLGYFSFFMEGIAPGAVVQAVLGTFAVFAVMLALFKTNIITGSARLAKFLFVAMLSYLVFMLVNFALTLAGVFDSFGGMLTGVTVFGIPLGLITGTIAVILGALSLSVDFRMIKENVGYAPQKMAWYFGFALMVSLVWIYTEILRLIGIVNITGD